jgi:hypothetical protein
MIAQKIWSSKLEQVGNTPQFFFKNFHFNYIF